MYGRREDLECKGVFKCPSLLSSLTSVFCSLLFSSLSLPLFSPLFSVVLYSPLPPSSDDSQPISRPIQAVDDSLREREDPNVLVPRHAAMETHAMEVGEEPSMASSRFSFSEDVNLANASPLGEPRSNITDHGGRGREGVAHIMMVGNTATHHVVQGARPVDARREWSRMGQPMQFNGRQRMSQRTQDMFVLLEQRQLKLRQEERNMTTQVADPTNMTRFQLQRKNEEVEELRKEVSQLRKQLMTAEDAPLYEMNLTPPHGKAIIIVNENFHSNPANPTLHLPRREGAQRDLQHFKATFEFLGYEVVWYLDITANEMYSAIDKVAIENHNAHDSLVCCVSSHGDENVMYGSDGIGVKRSEFLEPLKQTESLTGKPKMFFIQACRTRAESTTEASSKQPLFPASLDADIFIANATTANNPSYRSLVHGSWFVHALHHIFIKHAHHLTLVEMIYKVNSVVCDARGRIQDKGEDEEASEQEEAQQCAEWTSSFRKGVRFIPLQPSH